MHRSGTSCLAGSLQQAGLSLGKYHSWNRFNQKGSRENQDIVDFHDELLAANGGSWDSPPARLAYGSAELARARELIAAYRSSAPWGFKDPRTLLVLDLWREASGSLRCVGIFRHPRAVAASLHRRSGGRLALEQGLELWQYYNERLYRAWQQDHFPLLCFDRDEAEFHRQLQPVLESLGLRERELENRFYSRELLHFQSERWEGIPRRMKRLYEKLVEASAAPTRASS